MSQESSFIILRIDKKNKQTISDTEVIETCKRNGYNLDDDKDIFNKKCDIKDIPPYISFGNLKYVNHFNKEIYDKILDVRFNSMFSILKDEYNLSPYSVNNSMEISMSEAEAMLEAINYLLVERYDRIYEEDVLDNKYVKLFGDYYSPYINYYLKYNKTEKDEEGNSLLCTYNSEFLDEKFLLKRIKIVLDAFILLSIEDCWNDLKYVLLYNVY